VLETPDPAYAGTYRLKGAASLRPSAIGDDGRTTRMSWPAEVTQPAVFAVDPTGQEVLVNGRTENGMLVIEGIATRYLFRLGKDVAQADRVMDAKK
jgi:type IV secretion system protein VirB9